MSTDTTSYRDRLRAATHPVVFPVSALIILVVVIVAAVAPGQTATAFEATRDAITGNLGWLLIAVVALLLVVSVALIFSPYAQIRLGPDHSRPDYSTLPWFAMLFSAGMGIGLVFWAATEPALLAAEPLFEGQNQAQEAMRFAFHHWGFSPWGVYAVVGLGLAFFGFRRGMPMTIRSLFQPLLGDRVNGPIGHAIDILAVVATIFGVATSLGLGASQVAAGLERVFGLETAGGGMLAIIAAITAMAAVSVISGLDKGIKRLSQTNMVAAAGLAILVALIGPTLLLITAFVENTGYYLQNIVQTMAFTGSYAGDDAAAVVEGYTVFYWAWWISWSPFVGMFIARISYGRTIREFLLGVLLAPTIVSFAWFTIFGNSALRSQEVADSVAEGGEPEGMYALIESFAIPGWAITALSILVMFIVVVFFITSSDSASFVVDMITSGGNLNPAVETRLFWAIAEGAIAAVLLLAGGATALDGLQAGSVSTGLPFAILLVFATWGLLRGLRSERPDRPRTGGAPPVTIPDATRREQSLRALEVRERELTQKERELDIREAELEQSSDD